MGGMSRGPETLLLAVALACNICCGDEEAGGNASAGGAGSGEAGASGASGGATAGASGLDGGRAGQYSSQDSGAAATAGSEVAGGGESNNAGQGGAGTGGEAAVGGVGKDAGQGGTDAGRAGDAGASNAGDGGTQQPPACKRGVAYGEHSLADLAALAQGGVHWWYNWSPAPESAVAGGYASLGAEFVPMVWGGSFEVENVKERIPADAEYLLGFNEPNFYAQANLSAAEAAARWPDVERIADDLGLGLVSPAVNFCGGGCHETDPFAYLDSFLAACSGCRVDYIGAHWYACDGPALTWYLGELKKYGKPIWLTEFSCGDGEDRSLEKQMSYMTDAVAILEADPDVFRYAWFSGRTTAIPNVDLLAADGVLTSLGELYLSLPHHDPACAP
jgi:hypothetical protein